MAENGETSNPQAGLHDMLCATDLVGELIKRGLVAWWEVDDPAVLLSEPREPGTVVEIPHPTTIQEGRGSDAA